MVRFSHAMLFAISLMAAMPAFAGPVPVPRGRADRPARAEVLERRGTTGAPRQELAEFREFIDNFLSLGHDLQEQTERKEALEAELDSLKSQGGASEVLRGLLRRREIENLQVELHRLAMQLQDLEAQRRDMAATILERSQRWKSALDARLEAIEEQTASADAETTEARRQAEEREIQRRLALLESAVRESQQLAGPFRRGMRAGMGTGGARRGAGPGGGGGLGPGPGPGPVAAGGGMGPGAGLGPALRLVQPGDETWQALPLDEQIERLEQQQELLRRALEQNEAALERLRTRRQPQDGARESRALPEPGDAPRPAPQPLRDPEPPRGTAPARNAVQP